MKKFLSIFCLILSLCLFVTACGAPVETETEAETAAETETQKETETEIAVKEEKYMERTYTMADAKGYYRALGRVKESGSALICDWNASGAEFIADCVGDVKLTFNYGGSGSFMTVFIDDAFYKDIELVKGYKTYTIAEGLEQGIHFIRVVVQYARQMGSMEKITLTGKLIKTSQSDVMVEIIGDSITCGAFLSPTGSDYATKSYAYIAMNKLGVDYSICAKGGMPMSLPSSINSMYPYYNTERSATEAYVPTREPDLIIVNLGTNDNWQWYKQANNRTDHETFNYEAFDKGMAEFFENLDKIHGEKAVPVLFVFGCTTNPKYTVGTDRMQELIKTVYVPAGYDVEIMFLPTDRNGKDGHPSEEGAKLQGESLANQLKEKYPEIFG